MALVRGVMRDSSLDSSRFSVSGRMSAKTMRAPRRAKAFAVETNVKEGTITSSPARKSNKSEAISSACVQEVVSNARRTPRASRSRFSHFIEKQLLPAIRPSAIA